MTTRFVIVLVIFSSVHVYGSFKNLKKLVVKPQKSMTLKEASVAGRPVDISRLPDDYLFAKSKMRVSDYKHAETRPQGELYLTLQYIPNKNDELDLQSHGFSLDARLKSQDILDQKNHGQSLIVVIAEQSIAQRNAKNDKDKRNRLLGWRHHRKKK